MAVQTGVKATIPFIDPLKHEFDPTKIKVENNVAALMELYPSSEMFYFNFDVDDGNISKRGSATMELFGSDNTGTVEGELLTIGENVDRSAAKILNNELTTQNEIAGKLGFIMTVNSYSGDSPLMTIQNKIDLSKIVFYTSHVGAGSHRVDVDLYDATGTLVSTTVLDTVPYSIGSTGHITFSFKRLEDLYLYYDGDHVATVDVSAFNIRLDELDVFLGSDDGLGVCRSNIYHLQLINEDYYTSEGDQETGEIYSYERTLQKIKSLAPLFMDDFIGFFPEYSFESAGEIKHTVTKSMIEMYYDVSASSWKPVSNEETDYNTYAEIHEHACELEFSRGYGAPVQFSTLMLSTGGFISPEIITIGAEYDFFFDTGEPSQLCTVHGIVRDDFGCPVVGAIVRFVTSPKVFSGSVQVTSGGQAVTGPDGTWAKSLIQGLTVDSSVAYETINLAGTTVPVLEEYKGVEIPNDPSADYKDLVAGL